MKGIKQVSTRNNDVPGDSGLNELFSFVVASLRGDNSKKRTIVTDKEYSFTIRTTNFSGHVEDHVVSISQGQTLYFHRNNHDDQTNRDQFMVDEGDHAWHVNVGTGVVRYFNNNIYVSDKLSLGMSNVKVNGNGLSQV